MLRRALRTTCALVAAGAVAAGCGGEDPSREQVPPSATAPAIDEDAGRFRGVGIGSTRADVDRALGRVDDSPGAPATPLGAKPGEIGFPPTPQTPPGVTGEPETWRADDAALIASGGKAWLLVVDAAGARTARGVAIGDPLDKARGAYESLACDTKGRAEYSDIPYCTGKLGPSRFIWFGMDPIASVTISTHPLDR